MAKKSKSLNAKTKVSAYMTPSPHSINADLDLSAAKAMMKKYSIRHLPVRSAGKLVGVLTDRDVKLGTSLDRAEKLVVDEVMTPEPYSVTPDTALAEVVKQMAKKKYGCAIVKEKQGNVVGIFTASDALRVMAENLVDRSSKGQ